MLYNNDQIKEILPHRYPMLLIDTIESIDEIDGRTRVVAKKCVTANEPFFQGHFPNKQVMPGVLVIEALAQTGAFYVLSLDEFKGKIAYFAGANNIKWRRQVVPGDVLMLEVSISAIRRSIGYGEAKAYVDGEVVCQGELTFVVK